MTKFYSRIPPQMKNFKNLRFEITKVYSRIPPHEKLQIWDDQSLLRNTPPNEKLKIWDDQSLLRNTLPPKMKNFKNFRFEITKVYSGISPQMKNFRFEIWDDQILLWNTPPNEKLKIWDDQSLLRNTPPPPPNEKLQIWDDQSLLLNTPSPQWKTSKTSDLRWPKFTPEYPPPSRKACSLGDRMWRLICIPRGYHSFVICTLISISFSSLTQTPKASTAGYHQNVRGNRRSCSIEIIAEPSVHHSGNYLRFVSYTWIFKSLAVADPAAW